MLLEAPPDLMCCGETVGRKDNSLVTYMLATVLAFLVCSASFQRLKLTCKITCRKCFQGPHNFEQSAAQQTHPGKRDVDTSSAGRAGCRCGANRAGHGSGLGNACAREAGALPSVVHTHSDASRLPPRAITVKTVCVALPHASSALKLPEKSPFWPSRAPRATSPGAAARTAAPSSSIFTDVRNARRAGTTAAWDDRVAGAGVKVDENALAEAAAPTRATVRSIVEVSWDPTSEG